MATPPGFEPRLTGPKPVVLPLHHGVALMLCYKQHIYNIDPLLHFFHTMLKKNVKFFAFQAFPSGAVCTPLRMRSDKAVDELNDQLDTRRALVDVPGEYVMQLFLRAVIIAWDEQVKVQLEFAAV